LQNWNEGKAQEFKARKTYCVDKAVAVDAAVLAAYVAGVADASVIANAASNADASKFADATYVADASEFADVPEDELMLVTTKQCPNCAVAMSYMNDANIRYKVMEAELHSEIVSQYKVRSAPTLLVAHGKDYETFTNVSNIRAYVDSHLVTPAPV